jgi:hypothetical protein
MQAAMTTVTTVTTAMMAMMTWRIPTIRTRAAMIPAAMMSAVTMLVETT